MPVVNSYHGQTLLYRRVTRRVSYKKQDLLNICEHLSPPPDACGGVRVVHLFSFLCFPIMCLHSEFHIVMSVILIKTMFDSSLPPVVCRIYVFCVCLVLFFVCLFVCLFVLFFFSFLSCVVSFSGLSFFWIATSVFCNDYLISSHNDIMLYGRYDILIKTMFGSSLPPVVCRMMHVLFTLFVFVWFGYLLFVFCFFVFLLFFFFLFLLFFFSRLVYPMLPVSLDCPFYLDCHFGIL